MKKSILILIFILVVNSLTLAETSNVDVGLVDFDIKINGVSIDNSKQTYPFITYKNMTYMPLTWNIANGLGIKTKWNSQDGLNITRISKTSAVIDDASSLNDMSQTYQASIVNFPVTINGTTVYAFESDYPFLSFKGITYMPLTYDYLTNELFGQAVWDPISGLKIRTDRTISQNHIGYHGITDDYKSILREWLYEMNFQNHDKWLYYLNTDFQGKVLGLFQYNNDLKVTQTINNETLTYLLDKSKWHREIKVLQFSNRELESQLRKSYGLAPPYTAGKLGTITMLSLNGSEIKSLKDLDHFFNLEILSIENYRQNDLKLVGQLGALDNLNLSSTLEEESPLDLSFISDMSCLRSLSIKNYPIKENFDLGSLYQLEKLSLINCDLNNLDAIKHLNSLDEINVSKNHLTSLAGIENND